MLQQTTNSKISQLSIDSFLVEGVLLFSTSFAKNSSFPSLSIIPDGVDGSGSGSLPLVDLLARQGLLLWKVGRCPYCGNQISLSAYKCPKCNRVINEKEKC